MNNLGYAIDNIIYGDANITGNLTIGEYTLPSADGTSGQVLATNGAGVVNWATETGVGDVNFTGTAPVSVNEICAYNNTNGLEIKQTGISATGGHLFAQLIDPPAVQNFYLGSTNSTTTYISRAGQSTVIQGVSVHVQKAEFLSNVEMSNIYEYGVNNGITLHNDLKVNTIRERTGSAGVSFVNTINANTLNEYTPANGVIVNNILKVNEIEERTNPSGLTCNSVFKVDTIQEKTTDSGVLVDDVLHKDGGIRVLAGGLGNPSLSYASDPTIGIFFTNFPSMNAVCQGSGLFVGTSTYLELQSAEVRVANIVERIPTQGVQIEDLALVDRSIDAKTAGTMSIGGAVQTTLNIGRSGIDTEIKGPLLVDSIDAKTAGTMSIGGTTQTKVDLSRTGITTEVKGPLQANEGLLTDTISEETTNAGITIDGVLIKDKCIGLSGDTTPEIGFYNPNYPIIVTFTTISNGYNPIKFKNTAGGNTTEMVLGLYGSGATPGLTFQKSVSNNYQYNTIHIDYEGNISLLRAAGTMKAPIVLTNTINGISGTMNIGTSVSTAVSIGANGVSTTINGDLVWATPHCQGYYGTLATQGTATTTTTNANQDYAVAYGGGFVATDQISMTVSTDGLITYTGTKTRMFHTAWTISQQDNSNTVNKYSVFKNGAIVEGSTQQVDDGTSVGSTAIHIMMSLATGNTLQLYVRSASAGNIITMRQANVFCMAMTN